MFNGLISGLTATVPMTLFMLEAHRHLPIAEQYSLPPREIVDEIGSKAGIEDLASEETKVKATWASHFGYGAAMGCLYHTFEKTLPGRPITKGILFGSAVWAGSYMAWLPALNILKPVKHHPVNRTALMITAHWIFGAALGLAHEGLKSEKERRNKSS